MSKVKDTKRMFNNTFKFNQDLSGWNLSSVVESDGMFKGSFIEKYGSVWFPELHI
jgi:hypothetical protein